MNDWNLRNTWLLFLCPMFINFYLQFYSQVTHCTFILLLSEHSIFMLHLQCPFYQCPSLSSVSKPHIGCCLSGLSDLSVCTWREEWGLSEEIEKRQQKEWGRHPVNTVIHPKFITQSASIPQSRWGGHKTSWYKEQENIITSFHFKTPGNHILGQNILLPRQDICSCTLGQSFCHITLKEQE